MTFYSMACVHDCAVASDNANSMIHVWDQDGLWVGRLLDNPDTTSAPPEAYALCGENFGNSLFQVPTGMNIPGLHPGEVLLFGGGQNNTPVFRISGWDRFSRQRGEVTLTPGQAAGLTARAKAESQRRLGAHRLPPRDQARRKARKVAEGEAAGDPGRPRGAGSALLGLE